MPRQQVTRPRVWLCLELKLPNPKDKQEYGVVVASLVGDQLAGHQGLDSVSAADRAVIFALYAATPGIRIKCSDWSSVSQNQGTMFMVGRKTVSGFWRVGTIRGHQFTRAPKMVPNGMLGPRYLYTDSGDKCQCRRLCLLSHGRMDRPESQEEKGRQAVERNNQKYRILPQYPSITLDANDQNNAMIKPIIQHAHGNKSLSFFRTRFRWLHDIIQNDRYHDSLNDE